MTRYSGNFTTSSNDVNLGDGDESSFQTSANGSLNLLLSFDSSGNATGPVTGAGTVTGTSSGETDGDDDSFSDNLSGSGTATGSRQSGVNLSYDSNGGDFIQFSGKFNNTATAVTGTVTISDPNLSSNLTIPNVTLTGTQYRLVFTFTQSTINNGKLQAEIDQISSSGTMSVVKSFGTFAASCDPAFPLLSISNTVAAKVSSKQSLGVVFGIDAFAPTEFQSGVELHGASGVPSNGGNTGAASQYSWFSQGCLVTPGLLPTIYQYIIANAGSLFPSDPNLPPANSNFTNLNASQKTELANYINANFTTSLSTNVGLKQPLLSVQANTATNSFQFSLSSSIEKEVKVLYSVVDLDANNQVLTTREAFISPATSGPTDPTTGPISAASFASGWSINPDWVSNASHPSGNAPIGWVQGSPTLDPYITNAADDGLIGSTAAAYSATFGKPVTFDPSQHYAIGIDGYQVEYQDAFAPSDGAVWYFDSKPNDSSTDLTNEVAMFPDDSSDVQQFSFGSNGALVISSADLKLFDTTSGGVVSAAATPYNGPVAGLQHQFIYTGTDNINIAVTDANWFLKGGPGEDALQAFGGYNVLDGSTGSNFLTGGSGTDTFFVDDRSPPSDIWSTVNNFHQGDDATVFGIVNSPAIQWFDNQGATGFTGLTLHVFGQNAPTASLTLVGYSSADLSNGRLTVQFGSETDGTPFMHIIGTG